MRDFFDAFKVGLLVISGAVTFVVMSAQVREGIREDESSYRVSAILDDVGGLVQNSRVMIAGIPVGQIEQIELEGERARIWLVLDLPTPLLSDTRLVKRSAGLLGENFISLSPGQSGAPVLSGGQLHQVHQEVGPTE
ncbi:MAG: MlaD family protein, partial [Myxococcota bacterium]|nr:MlaD family protein [Myxococcota bacterium]